MVRRIIVAVECLNYDYIQTIKPENILKLDPHPAVAFGVGSRPSAAALMGGMLPICQIPECDHRIIKDKWSNPFFLTCMKEITEKQFYLVANGWIIEILLPWMTKEQRKLNLYWHDRHLHLPGKDITNYFLEQSDGVENFFAYLHYFESHWPFYSPQGHGEGHREDAVKFVDGEIGRILDKYGKDTEIILTADHNIPPRKVSAANDVPAPSTMLAYIAANFTSKETKSWAELGINPMEVTKKHWC